PPPTPPHKGEGSTPSTRRVYGSSTNENVLAGRRAIERQVQRQHVHPRLAQEAEGARLDMLVDELPHAIFPQSAGLLNWRALEKKAAAGEMCGSRPPAEVVTRSTGTAAEGFSCLSLSTSPCTRSISALLVGPRFEPPELAAL